MGYLCILLCFGGRREVRYEGLRLYIIFMVLSNFVGFCVLLCVKSVLKFIFLMLFSCLVVVYVSLVVYDLIFGVLMLNFFLFLD